MIRALRNATAVIVGGLCVAAVGQFLAGGGIMFLLCAAVAAWNAWRLLRRPTVVDPLTGRLLTDDDYQKILDWLDQPEAERQ